ncbi:hypothetical protein NDU88_001918 [Pleurodeles waltl]|uniref:Uncharacterized protein n=1 Tax=Pleurodeles waltl TaxID=8319 RepID=A0AAV7RAF4_PLEWA|nr:hypothetical protein NDU88_001918 [Pleurodeles waltl]
MVGFAQLSGQARPAGCLSPSSSGSAPVTAGTQGHHKRTSARAAAPMGSAKRAPSLTGTAPGPHIVTTVPKSPPGTCAPARAPPRQRWAGPTLPRPRRPPGPGLSGIRSAGKHRSSLRPHFNCGTRLLRCCAQPGGCPCRTFSLHGFSASPLPGALTHRPPDPLHCTLGGAFLSWREATARTHRNLVQARALHVPLQPVRRGLSLGDPVSVLEMPPRATGRGYPGWWDGEAQSCILSVRHLGSAPSDLSLERF